MDKVDKKGFKDRSAFAQRVTFTKTHETEVLDKTHHKSKICRELKFNNIYFECCLHSFHMHCTQSVIICCGCLKTFKRCLSFQGNCMLFCWLSLSWRQQMKKMSNISVFCAWATVETPETLKINLNHHKDGKAIKVVTSLAPPSLANQTKSWKQRLWCGRAAGSFLFSPLSKCETNVVCVCCLLHLSESKLVPLEKQWQKRIQAQITLWMIHCGIKHNCLFGNNVQAFFVAPGIKNLSWSPLWLSVH